MDVRSMTKIDLHRHLEGAIRLSTVIDLSREAGLALPAWTPEELAPDALITAPVPSLEVALQAFGFAQRSIHDLAAVHRIAREAVEDLDAEHTRLAELRFSPEFLCETAGLDWDGAMEALREGVDEAASRLDVAVGLIAIFSRDYGVESLERTVAFALRHREHLVGFDIAGGEAEYPPGLYAGALDPIREAGLGITVHYGESGPPPFVREAIEVFDPSRIGHGLSTAWDAAVEDLVIERGVTLEMCPTSNWLTHGVDRVADHPIRRLLGDGVAVTLNTDDPGIMGIDLNHEWEVAETEIGFTLDDFRAVTRNALAASFLPPDRREGVARRHFAWVEEPDAASVRQGPRAPRPAEAT
jgi:adenosine deaminase